MDEDTSDHDFFPAGPQYYAKYYVNGFRSLHDFNIRLEEGLNVFSGPNGSGKTNFIDFLDFISILLIRGTAAATSHLGGLSRVFSQETLKSKRPRLHAQICGLADLKPFVQKTEDRTLFRYEYDVDIRFSKQHSTMYIASENIKFKAAFWDDLAVYAERTIGSISLRRKAPTDDSEPIWEVGKRLLTRGPRNPFRYRSRTGLAANNKSFSEEILDAPRLAPDESFLSLRPSWPAIDAVRASLSRGRSFNLVPSSARSPDDLSRPPMISVDGSGLSATLYQMQQFKKSARPSRSVYLPNISKDSLDTVISWTSLVLPELIDISTIADPQTGKYISYLVLSSDDHSLRIPLQSASDGTLKWLSFVCLINGHGSIYSLEEPENYLHPRMQTFLISLIRESLSSKHPGYFILTTHSETIINQCNPEELILFDFKGGRTTIKRLDNPDTVRDQINKTGFGLGYYYAANAIS